jgi:hypothetical protein
MKVDQLFPSRWLHPEALGGRAVTVTIAKVTLEEINNPTTNRKESKPAVAFKGATKLLLLNKTQALAIARITGRDDTDNWPGCRVTLAADIAPNGKQTIRVSPVPVADPNPVANAGPDTDTYPVNPDTYPGPDADADADPDGGAE